jgi:integrase
VHVERGFTDEGGEDLPKSYRVRSVPLMPQVARVLSELRKREFFTTDDDLVFASLVGDVLGYDVMYRRYKRAQECAGVRPLRFQDLRHSFGTMAVRLPDHGRADVDGARGDRDHPEVHPLRAAA